MRPLVIDNFAGGGGASTGLERAIGRPIDIAINHDPEAVAMHLANHPTTRHYCQSIMAVDPLDATGGAPVALVWFSPDCKHHSKAKGGKPREKNIRDLAWVVVHWAERLGGWNGKVLTRPERAPRVIMLENVEEFRQWGPLDAEGMPIKERRGEEFDLWVRRLKRCGYRVEWRELRACDYGAPTSRKRLYLIARRDGLPIVWPEPTHGKPGSPEVERGERRPWRTAAECIDWSIPCPSIFDRKRELKDATKRRIAHGVMRYVVNAERPFVVPVNDDDACAPHITKFRNGSIGSAGDVPTPTVTANGASARPAGATPLGLVGATLVGVGGRRAQSPPMPVTGGWPTQTAKADAAIAVAHLEKFSENSRGRPSTAPLDAAMAGAPRHAAVTAFLSTFYSNGGKHDARDPSPTAMAGSNKHAVVCAHMEQANTGVIGHPIPAPVSTIVGKGCTQRLVETTLVDADSLPPDQLQRAVRVAAFLVKYYGNEIDGHGLGAPIGTVTTKDCFAVVTVTIDAVTYVVVDIGMRMLTRRELANAQGFAPDYILDPLCDWARRDDGTWKRLPKPRPLPVSSSIRMIGNSVCPDVAASLAAANVDLAWFEQVAA